MVKKKNDRKTNNGSQSTVCTEDIRLNNTNLNCIFFVSPLVFSIVYLFFLSLFCLFFALRLLIAPLVHSKFLNWQCTTYKWRNDNGQKYTREKTKRAATQTLLYTRVKCSCSTNGLRHVSWTNRVVRAGLDIDTPGPTASCALGWISAILSH
jgi:hypothetical protein